MYDYLQQNYNYYYYQVFYKDVYFYLFLVTFISLIILVVLYFYYKKKYKPLFIRNKKIFRQISNTINDFNHRLSNNNMNHIIEDEESNDEIKLHNIKVLNNNSKVQIGCPIYVLSYLAINECKAKLTIENCFGEKQIYQCCLKYKKNSPNIEETCVIWKIFTVGKFFQNVVNVRIKLETECLSTNYLTVDIFWLGCLLSAFETCKPYIYQCDLNVINNSNLLTDEDCHCRQRICKCRHRSYNRIDSDCVSTFFAVDVILEARIHDYILCNDNDDSWQSTSRDDAEQMEENYFREKSNYYLVIELFKFQLCEIDSFERVHTHHSERYCFGQPTKVYVKWSNVTVTKYTCLFAHVVIYTKCENIEKSAFTCLKLIDNNRCNKNIVLM